MRVLICIPCLLTGGTEIQTLNLVRALVFGGHEVVTACYFEHSDYMVNLFMQAGSNVIVFSNDGIRAKGIVGFKFLWQGLRKVVYEFQPDVAHVQYMAPGAQPVVILKALRVKNIIVTVHTNADIYNKLGVIRFLQKRITRAWTCITTRAEEEFFGSSHLYDENTHMGRHNHFTIYNALPSHIKVTDKLRERKDMITIGVVSRLEAIKGMDLVVPAFKKVYEKHKNVRLLVVGDGSLRQQMESESAEITPLTLFSGRQGQDTLQDYYDQIDILLMPSRSEGFGLTAIEGMARGCVVVASNTGGLPEVVRDGETGLLHKPEDVDDLSDKICQLIDNTELYQKMHTRTYEYVKRYSFERFSILFNSVYSRL